MTPPEEVGAGNLERNEPLTEVFRFAKNNVFHPSPVTTSRAGATAACPKKKAVTIGDGLSFVTAGLACFSPGA